jgi:predicted lipoprotein
MSPEKLQNPTSKPCGRYGWVFGSWSLVLGAFLVLCFLVPPFHIIPLSTAGPQSIATTFNASAFVEKLWTDQFVKITNKATDAATLLTELKRDPKTTREKYSRTLGLGSTYYYLVSGTGRVVAVEKDSVSLAVGLDNSTPDIRIETGHIFGNAVRDGTGVVNVNDFPNSRDFNDISSEINRRIEERVLPALRLRATIGAMLHFSGCAEVAAEETEFRSLTVVPISAERRD